QAEGRLAQHAVPNSRRRRQSGPFITCQTRYEFLKNGRPSADVQDLPSGSETGVPESRRLLKSASKLLNVFGLVHNGLGEMPQQSFLVAPWIENSVNHLPGIGADTIDNPRRPQSKTIN